MEEKEKPKEEETEKPKEEEYKLVIVPTGEAIAIQTPTGETITTEQAMVEILNLVKNINKKL